MKGRHAYVLIVVVIVAVLVNVHAHRSTRRLVREVQGSVRSLRDEVRELRAMVGVIGLRLEAFSAPSARVLKQPAVSKGSGADVAVEPPVDDVGDVQIEPVDVLLEIDAARKCTLDGQETARDALKAELKGLLKANPAMRLVVRAHESVPMSEVEELIAIAGEAGIYRVDTEAMGDGEAPDASE